MLIIICNAFEALISVVEIFPQAQHNVKLFRAYS